MDPRPLGEFHPQLALLAFAEAEVGRYQKQVAEASSRGASSAATAPLVAQLDQLQAAITHARAGFALAAERRYGAHARPAAPFPTPRQRADVLIRQSRAQIDRVRSAITRSHGLVRNSRTRRVA